MRDDDHNKNPVKTAVILSFPAWIIIGLGMAYISLVEPNNSGLSDLLMLLLELGLALVMCSAVFWVYLNEVRKQQGD
jgi:uncharacterized membrane protein